MAKSILCVIDFSESSLNALKWAADLSACLSAHLTILYPYRLLQTTKGDVLQVKRQTEESALKKFEGLEIEHLKGKVPSFNFSAEVGFFTDRIETHIKKIPTTALVIGKNMNSTSQENLEDLIRHVDVPVIVVP